LTPPNAVVWKENCGIAVAEIFDEELTEDAAGKLPGLFEFLREAAFTSRYVPLDLVRYGGLRPGKQGIQLSVSRAQCDEPDAHFVEHAEVSPHGESAVEHEVFCGRP